MFDDQNEEPQEQARTAAERVKEKTDEFRMHAELAAVFEACRKFDAAIYPDLDPQRARDIQRTFARLEKSKNPDSPILPESSWPDTAAVLKMPESGEVSTNNYHVHRRPGEVMVVRWLAGEQVDIFYERLQAHFDAALEGYRDDERSQEWKQDPKTLAYLKALDAVELKMADRYLREVIRTHKIFVLSTQTADEINIAYLTETVMGVPAVELVGRASAPPDEQASERDLAWFFKLFSLRGMDGDVERTCFFTFLQKTEETFDLE